MTRKCVYLPIIISFLTSFSRHRSLTLNSPLFVLPCFVISCPPSSFSPLRFASSSVLCYPSSALISLPTGTSGSIFGWWAAEGLKRRVSQRCVCGWYVCSNWLWCCSPRHHLCFFPSVFWCVFCMCVWHQTLLLCWDFVTLYCISLRITCSSACVW